MIKTLVNFYRSFENPADRDTIKVVAGLGLISLVVALYLVIMIIW